jgi:hypothetical protein
MVKDLSWKHVAVILGFFVAVVVLAVTKNETGSLVLVGMGIFGAIGLGVAQVSGAKEATTAVKEQTNGNWSAVLGILERQGQMLAAAHPPAVTLDPFTPPGTSGGSTSAD